MIAHVRPGDHSFRIGDAAGHRTRDGFPFHFGRDAGIRAGLHAIVTAAANRTGQARARLDLVIVAPDFGIEILPIGVFAIAPVFRAVKIPVLGDIPLIGPMLFQQNIFVYGALIMVAVATYYLFYTRSGLRARAVGEHPRAADTLGINVYRTRYINVTVAGMVAGFGGAWFTLGTVGRFDENMTGGRGFIGLAAMIFGRWHPVGAFMAALVFGFADSLQQKLALLETPIPSEFLAMAPYVATIIVVAGLIGRARPPAADGKAYVKE